MVKISFTATIVSALLICAEANPLPHIGGGRSSSSSGNSISSTSSRTPLLNPGSTSSSRGFQPVPGYRPYGAGPAFAGGLGAGALIGAGGVYHGYSNSTIQDDAINVFENASYPDVVKIGTHNSYAIGDDLADNQTKDLKTQLDDGVRLLQAQGHSGDPSDASPSGISLCHTSCLLRDGGSLEAWLKVVADWLIANPLEVVSLLLTNPDDVSIDQWGRAFESLNLDQKAFLPTKGSLTRSEWPTYGRLIADDRRLVVFIDRGASFSKYPYIVDEFSNIWENQYNQLDLPFNCTLDRGAPIEGKMGLINHFHDKQLAGIDYPNKDTLNQVNSADGDFGLISGFDNCTATSRGIAPTFILVNYYDQPSTRGSVFGAAVLNNISDPNASDEVNGAIVASMAKLTWIALASIMLGLTFLL